MDERLTKVRSFLLRFLIGVVVSFGIFSIFLVTQKQNPLDVYKALVTGFTTSKYNVGEIWV